MISSASPRDSQAKPALLNSLSSIRRKVRGRTKTEVRDKLRDLRGALDGGVRPSARYTVQQAVDDWLEMGSTAGRSRR